MTKSFQPYQENIESNLEKIRQDREFWAKNNPDEVKFIKEIQEKF